MRPGAIVFTVMPCGPSSQDNVRDQLTRAALAGAAPLSFGATSAPDMCLVPERIVRFTGGGPRTAGVVDEDIDTPAKSRQGFGCDLGGTAFRTNIPDDDRR